MSVYSESDFNAELLLHGGYVWEEARATSVTLRLSAGDLASRRESRDGYDAEVEARRTELLGAKNWSAVALSRPKAAVASTTHT